jgi:Flp pilus assembly protein TadG
MLAQMMSDNSYKRWRDLLRSSSKGVLREDGASMVEMAFACTLLLTMLFGIFAISFALYTYHYISDAAREGSRYAMVRGSTSCANSSNMLTNCGATSNQIQTYVQNLGYPGASNMTVTSTWYKITGGTPWASLCSTGTCNAPGNIVKVQVTYAFPLSIPFFLRGGPTSQTRSLSMTSTSQMVIAQ